MYFRAILTLGLAMIGILSACQTLPDRLTAVPVGYDALSGWEEADIRRAASALERTCHITHQSSQDPALQQLYSPADWQYVCTKLKELRQYAHGDNPAALRKFIEAYLTPVQLGNNDDPNGLFTGYYEPLLQGSRTRNATFRYPLYRKPSRMTSPYFTRREIDGGALRNQGLELVYVDDPVALFFLQVQGS
ncbi:MAG: MltA domain-containing protein, partial [Rickettsiales bacterium]|nr:MltA domain-containing protein [Rickettsiales bacterium]